MKNLMFIIIFTLIQVTGIAQTNGLAKTETVEFKVFGNCGMCKNRIEKALKVEGVESAKWDAKKNIVTVAYQPGKIKERQLHQLIADVGHDTEKITAKNESYNKLHGCCKYERPETKTNDKENHESHKH